MTDPYGILSFDCELACMCEGEPSYCPNVQAFGAAAVEYAQRVTVRNRDIDDIPSSDI